MIIERLDEDLAVIEEDNGNTRMVPVTALPPNAAEGDYIKLDKKKRYIIDKEKTDERRLKIAKKLNQLFGE